MSIVCETTILRNHGNILGTFHPSSARGFKKRFFLAHGFLCDYVEQHTCPFQLAFEIVNNALNVLSKLLEILIFLTGVVLELFDLLFAFRRS